mmetsp:Transcript_42787/g.128463  ORF Transcript_42787/g.128463 Transcript_42787/m.128463 type:complete len:240 (+) Transcript_42787:1045-1764(+)
MKLARGPLGSTRSARLRWMACATASTASSCPMMRLCSSSVRCRSFSRSLATSFVMGMPVQRLTTLAMSPSATSTLGRPCCRNAAKLIGPAACARFCSSAISSCNASTRDRNSPASSTSPSSSASSASRVSASICPATRIMPPIKSSAGAAAGSARRAASAAASAISLRWSRSVANSASRSASACAAATSPSAFGRIESTSMDSCVILRSSASSASGLSVCSILTCAVASSIRSMALSGR